MSLESLHQPESANQSLCSEKDNPGSGGSTNVSKYSAKWSTKESVEIVSHVQLVQNRQTIDSTTALHHVGYLDVTKSTLWVATTSRSVREWLGCP